MQTPFFEHTYPNTNTGHPLIANSQEYLYYKKYVSIHSEDRDVLKYPQSNEFDIELPEDLLNVMSIRLSEWTFPSNYNTFSILNNNLLMTFKIVNPYNPSGNIFDNLQYAIYECLFYTTKDNYEIIIEEGFYNPIQMVTELTNKFNEAVTNRIILYFTNIIINPSENKTGLDYQVLLDEFKNLGGYNKFVIVYNTVGQKIWFGNKADPFVLTNQISAVKDSFSDNLSCNPRGSNLPNFSNWGLPSYLGLARCNITSTSTDNINKARFYYGDVYPGDYGYWLLPNSNSPNSQINYLECPFKINFMGQSHFYMEIAGQNCIDETSPYNVSKFTIQTNNTNGRVNAAFAKIAVPTIPLAQWFDRECKSYKIYTPPAERIRKLSFKLRYHDNQLVNFGNFDFSFTLEFVQLVPTQLNKIKSYSQSSQFTQSFLN